MGKNFILEQTILTPHVHMGFTNHKYKYKYKTSKLCEERTCYKKFKYKFRNIKVCMVYVYRDILFG